MADPLWTVHATLVSKGFEYVRPVAVYQGPIFVHGKRATVEVDISDVTFANLPTVKLLDDTNLAVNNLAHVMTGGLVCYVGQGGLPLDLYNPGGSILRVLAESEAALERSFGGGAPIEFEAELASYWRGSSVLVALPRGKAPAIVHSEIIPQSGDEGASLVVVAKGQWDHIKPRYRSPVTALKFAANLRYSKNFPPASLAEAIGYVADQQAPPLGWQQAVLSAAVAGRKLFLVAPNAIVGWDVELPAALRVIATRKQGFRPDYFRTALQKSASEIKLQRLTGTETDLRFCVDRNIAGGPSFVGKNVVVVGCGTIGSHLAKILVQTGAGCEGNLSLYDNETLSPGNLGRHLLGFSEIGKGKAHAVAEHLRGFHPDVAVKPYGVDATAEWTTLERADIVIDATGDPNVATALNEFWMKSGRAGSELALLHSWVFGNGVAAQSFLNLKDGHACYRCLKTSFDGRWRHNPLKDPRSPLLQAPARCGEAGYIPFAVDAPISAAGLALRAGLDWAGGNPGRRLRTLILDYRSGREAMKWVSPAPLADCPACGK